MLYGLRGLRKDGRWVNITGCEKLTEGQARQLKEKLEKKGVYERVERRAETGDRNTETGDGRRDI